MPSRVERSVLKTGNSLAATMPPDWLRLFNIKSGDKLDLIYDTVILIKPISLKLDYEFLKKEFELIIELSNLSMKEPDIKEINGDTI